MNANIYALIFTGLIFSAAAGAGEPLDTTRLDDPEVHAASCRAVNWNADLLAQYPGMAEACQEVIVADGERWARFETELVRVNRDGSVKSDFRDRQGDNMGAITIMPSPNQRVMIDGREYRFSELRPGQVLNVYVPEGANSFALAPSATVEQIVEVVEIEPEPYVEPDRMAYADTLPSTASPLPWLAVSGALALLGGLGFTIRRRFLSGSE